MHELHCASSNGESSVGHRAIYREREHYQAFEMRSCSLVLILLLRFSQTPKRLHERRCGRREAQKMYQRHTCTCINMMYRLENARSGTVHENVIVATRYNKNAPKKNKAKEQGEALKKRCQEQGIG